MIVDDDPHIQLALRQIVESVGHRVIEASNGQEAIELFEEFHPDLVITDVFMPQTDGIETIRAIRQIQPEARIIVISGGYFGSGWNYLDWSSFSAPIWRSEAIHLQSASIGIDRLLGARDRSVRHTNPPPPAPASAQRAASPPQALPSLSDRRDVAYCHETGLRSRSGQASGPRTGAPKSPRSGDGWPRIPWLRRRSDRHDLRLPGWSCRVEVEVACSTS